MNGHSGSNNGSNGNSGGLLHCSNGSPSNTTTSMDSISSKAAKHTIDGILGAGGGHHVSSNRPKSEKSNDEDGLCE